MNKPEILAPAGSYEAFLAAVHNGCDAVYLGGKAYGARAYADNFDIETLTRACTYAGGFGVKVYYTINTLFKEKELAGLINHVGQVLNAGVDALIVQDLGVTQLIRESYPSAELHVSTQMNCHSLEGLGFLEDMGVTRVVLARELNLSEIGHIGNNTSMELETFVHGALCYCYSGQCLMSSFLGGRSGNRGRCAQPCRLAYKGIIEDQVHDASHVLSPKDIESLTVLGDIIDAGVHSLKIEGRMKSPEYVGLMTALYRKYRDIYMEEGTYTVSQKDMDEVLQVFNRGGFSNGYYNVHNGREMITLTQPKNQGKEVGHVLVQKGQTLQFMTKTGLVAGDCLEFRLKDGSYESIIIQHNIHDKGSVKIKGNAEAHSPVRRIKSIALSDSLNERNQNFALRDIQMTASLQINEPALLTVLDGEEAITVQGDMVQEAKKQGISKEKVIKQLKKTGGLPVRVTDVTVNMPSNVFMAVSQLNALRRSAMNAFLSIENREEIQPVDYVSPKPLRKAAASRNITVLLNNSYQIETVMAYDVKRVYLEWMNFTTEDIQSVLNHPKILNGETQIWLAVPRITRYEKSGQIKGLLKTFDERVSGFLVRSIDSYGHVSGFGKPIRLDYGMNLMNTKAVDVVFERMDAEGYMPSLELKFGELKGLDLKKAEIMIYGHVKSMISAQCVRKTLEGCTYDTGYFMTIEDRKGMDVPVETNCLLCYNTIYNGTPLYLADKMKDYMALGVSEFRMDFVKESEREINQLMEAVILGQDLSPNRLLGQFTRGHYNKGVE